jgi:hypothetical protein
VLGVAAPRREPGDHTISSVAAVLLSLLTGEHQSGTGSSCTPGRRARPPTPWRPPRWAPRSVPRWSTWRGTSYASSSPPTASPPRSPAGPWASARPSPPAEWASADAQAARALARARATRTALVRHGARPALVDLVPEAEAEAHARTLLAPVTATPALTETLRTWLSLHGSWDRTAVALAVHRNTVRQRIARCAALLDADLDDPDVRMDLWFALRRL